MQMNDGADGARVNRREQCVSSREEGSSLPISLSAFSVEEIVCLHCSQ